MHTIYRAGTSCGLTGAPFFFIEEILLVNRSRSRSLLRFVRVREPKTRHVPADLADQLRPL